jgi:hypothetical protein
VRSGLEYIFIDCENVALKSIPDHDRICMLFLFVGEKQKNVPIEIAESMGKLGPKAEFVRMHGAGKNALDFHIAYYLGKCAEIDPKGIFRIVSKDTGFDPLVKHLQAAEIDCSRVENLSTKVISRTDLQGMIAELGTHLREKSVKARPKKAGKLKAYIQNRYREEAALVDEVFAGLASAGLFVLDGTKIKYQDSP